MPSEITERVLSLIGRNLPQGLSCEAADADRPLIDLGFDSMALIGLFIEMEDEFDLSVAAMASCLHSGCTLADVLTLCGATRV